MPCERKHIEAIQVACEDHEENDSQDTLCAVEDAISAALSACDQSPRRGMESAPKDGRFVDLFVGASRLPDCYWSFADSAWMHYTTDIRGFRCWAKVDPAHWMPLPEAPRKDET